MLKACGGKIPEKDLCASGRFSTNLFRYITDSKVDRVCGFVMEHSDLCFISRNDDGNDSCPWPLFVELFLFNIKVNSMIEQAI